MAAHYECMLLFVFDVARISTSADKLKNRTVSLYERSEAPLLVKVMYFRLLCSISLFSVLT